MQVRFAAWRATGVNPSQRSRYEVPRSGYGTLNSRMSSDATQAGIHRWSLSHQ